ncbi:FliH/SctL family protein [Brevirhabdus sp.]|uniref:FliH/SctL family protein n=1 Tax=Brevirhabdus sp. TaxID=2004514 RepID=UPI004059AF35
MLYVFERTFDSDTARPAVDPATQPIYTRAEFDAAVARARAEGAEAGRTAGRDEATAAMTQSDAARELSALEAMAPVLRDLFADRDRHHRALEAQLLQFLLTVFDQVAGDVIGALAPGQAEREARGAVRMALGSASLTMFLPPEQAAAGGAHVLRMARLHGFGGRVEVQPDPALSPGDIRAEWDHGVMEYSFNDICQRIRDALAAQQAARAAQGPDRPAPGTEDARGQQQATE